MNHDKSIKTQNEIFENPPSEYRSAPFWAWNDDFGKDLIDEEIDVMKDMGMGGFFIHPRIGLSFEFMGEKYLNNVAESIRRAKENKMFAFLYDEDRFPSGAAGGTVTKNIKYRQRKLLFTRRYCPEATDDIEKAINCGNLYLIAVYDISFNEKGEIASYRQINKDAEACGKKYYAYMLTASPSEWYNGNTYVDTFSKEAMDEFIKITYEKYYEKFGDEFGKTIPAVFADEPQFAMKKPFPYAKADCDAIFPWTYDFAETYNKKYSEDLIAHIPEMFFELQNGKISKARYLYHLHTSERIAEAFLDNCGKWCKDHGVHFTGHIMGEDSLCGQTESIGEAMRQYKEYGIPGIDMLCNRTNYATVKQCQSAVRQYGKAGMLSELYGVTNWDFDFRGHKFGGDWQAAMGVTLRTHHLYWASMHGEAKRDYPASIGHQDSWYKEYSMIEDHFARINTAMTKGLPIVKIGVIHPIESYWLHYGPKAETFNKRKQLDDNFRDLNHWLSDNLLDFDFISESLLPDQIGKIGNKLQIGIMEYDTVIVPELQTMRRSTFDILKKYRENGGKIIFMGKCPKYIDADESDELKSLYNACINIPFNKYDLLDALENERIIDIYDKRSHLRFNNFVYQFRKDCDLHWLFIANIVYSKNIYNSKPKSCIIKIKGEYYPELYDTLTGKIKDLKYTIENGYTLIDLRVFSSDSILIKLSDKSEAENEAPEMKLKQIGFADFKDKVKFKRSELNVFLLDKAEYKWDDMDEYLPEEEILYLDTKIRNKLGLPEKGPEMRQPWATKENEAKHKIYLHFSFESEIEISGARLALEEIESTDIVFNGKKLDMKANGYFVDRAIKTVDIPKIIKGINHIYLEKPIGTKTQTEWMYLLGDFSVKLAGTEKAIAKDNDKIAFGSITNQGMPFYGANIEYECEIDVPEDCSLAVRSGAYIGACAKVRIDDSDEYDLTFEPYSTIIPNVSKGKHRLIFTLFGTRFNTFGTLHLCDPENIWCWNNSWRTGENKGIIKDISPDEKPLYESEKWCEEYNVKDMGMMYSPIVFFMK